MAAGIESPPETNPIVNAAVRTHAAPDTGLLPRALQRLIDQLTGVARPLHWDELLPALADAELLEIDPDALARQASTADGVLHTAEHFEILCLSWPPGEQSSVHDHRGSRCCFRVLRGTLCNTDFVCAGGQPRPIRSYDVPEGVLLLKQDRETHQVANRRSRAAISLHIYSPPLPK